VSASAYDDALKRKKNPKQMAAAFFEKQVQAKREQAASKAKADEEAGGDDADAAASHGSLDQSGAATGHAEAAAYGQSVGQSPAMPDGWGAAWDTAANAYYYYSSTGQTQWEPPVAQGGGAGGHQGGASTAAAAEDDPSLPLELRRELKKQAQRGGGSLHSFAEMSQQDFWNGEKHREYTSMSAAYHVPMNVGAPPCPCVPPFCAPQMLCALRTRLCAPRRGWVADPDARQTKLRFPFSARGGGGL